MHSVVCCAMRMRVRELHHRPKQIFIDSCSVLLEYSDDSHDDKGLTTLRIEQHSTGRLERHSDDVQPFEQMLFGSVYLVFGVLWQSNACLWFSDRFFNGSNFFNGIFFHAKGLMTLVNDHSNNLNAISKLEKMKITSDVFPWIWCLEFCISSRGTI